MKLPPTASPNAGFTTVELAIVVTIIGLIIGGVVTAQGLIRSAMVSNAMKEAEGHISAINTFRQQYRYLPGDFNTATSYWSASADGNGNGQVAGAERFRAWEQLYFAGLSAKKVSGQQGSGSDHFVIGENVPDSRFKNGGFAFYYSGNAMNPVGAGNANYVLKLGNMLTFGAPAGGSNPPINAALTPNEAYHLDAKADDGIPGTGKWIANLRGPSGEDTAHNFSGANACASGTNAGPGTYNVNIDTKSCSFFIATGN